MTAAARPSRAWIFRGIWAVLAILLVVRATARPDGRGVILDHLEFGRRLLHGEDVHGPWQSSPRAQVAPLHAPYPPSFGLLTAPFAVINAIAGKPAARAAWALLQVASLVLVALLLRRLVARTTPASDPGPSPSYWHWRWLLVFALGLRFILRDSHGGGGNLLNLAMCLWSFDLAERQRDGRAGMLLGFSLATKPTQLWLLPLFWCLGRRRVVAAASVTMCVAFGCTLLLQRGDATAWLRWLEGSYRLGTQADAYAVPALDFPPFEWMNQSLRFAVARWFGTVPEEFASRVALGVPPGLQLPAAVVEWATRLLSLFALAALLLVAFRTRRARQARLATFASALVLSVLLSPLSWKAHHVALLPMLFLIVQQLLARPPGARGRLLTLLCLFALCCCLPGQDVVGDAIDEWCNSVYFVTGFDLVLLGVGLAMARSAAREHG